MSKILVHILQLAIPAMVSVAASAQSTPAPTRGELLYTTHCIACHSSQVHWRAKREATDWPSLKMQVRQWQSSIGLQWSEADIVEVARYLNTTTYRYPQTSDRPS
jgi:mono/diheme cytochrome c family protein